VSGEAALVSAPPGFSRVLSSQAALATVPPGFSHVGSDRVALATGPPGFSHVGSSQAALAAQATQAGQHQLMQAQLGQPSQVTSPAVHVGQPAQVTVPSAGIPPGVVDQQWVSALAAQVAAAVQSGQSPVVTSPIGQPGQLGQPGPAPTPGPSGTQHPPMAGRSAGAATASALPQWTHSVGQQGGGSWCRTCRHPGKSAWWWSVGTAAVWHGTLGPTLGVLSVGLWAYGLYPNRASRSGQRLLPSESAACSSSRVGC
jgi:hypothetical protein